MRYMVKCFSEVKGCSQFMVESKDLSLTTSLCPESMLVVVETVIFLQVFLNTVLLTMTCSRSLQNRLVRETGL